jgi:hypothetical protein
MATITPVIIKNSSHEVVVKMTGNAGDTGTINLSTLANANQTQSGTATVNIAGVRYAGTTSSVVAVTRDSTNVMTFSTEGVDGEEFASGWVDNQENTANIDLAISGGTATVWLTLRKQAGFLNNIETGIYGVYDDESQAGA